MEELVEACKDGRLSDVQRVLEETALDPCQRDENGWSPLHYASQRGHLPVVEYLLGKGCDPSSEAAQDRTTPLHLACANDRVDVALRLLRALPQGAPLRKSKDGNTPLHLACTVGSVSIVRAVLARSQAAAYSVTNQHGATPFGIAVALAASNKGVHLEVANVLLDRVFGNPARQIRDFRSLFPVFKPRHSLDHPVKVFALGDPQSGKSTLIKALQGESATKQIRGYTLMNVHGVNNHKVGLVPTDFPSRLIDNRVILYDLASSRDFIHENLIQSEEDVATSVFIICVDMKEERKDIAESMLYWMSFVYHQCAQYCSTQIKPSIAIVGSFWDVPRLFSLVPAQRLHLEYNQIIREAEFSSRFNLLRKYTLDCRKQGSLALHKLRSALRKHCESAHVRRSVGDSVPGRWYVLSTVLESEFPNIPAIQLHELRTRVSAGSPLNGLLPQTAEELLQLCQYLEERERVILIKPSGRSEIDSTWIVHRGHQLLSRIDTALVGAPGSAELTGSPAVMTSEDLKERLSTIPLDFNTLVQLMDHFQVCEAFTSPSSQQLFYIPGLLPKKHKVPSWDHDSSYYLRFAWAFEPGGRLEYFMPRFLKFLLLHLLTFAKAAEFENCTVWSEGICFSTDQEGAVHVCVMVNRKAVVLNMRCKRNHEIDCLAYRNQILELIRKSRESYQPQVKISEFILPSTPMANFPRRDIHSRTLGKISVTELKREILEGSDPSAKLLLPFFEPYLCLCKLPDTYRHTLTSLARTSQHCSRDVVAAIVTCFGQDKWKALADHFELGQLDDVSTGSSSIDPDEPEPALDKQGVAECGYLLECLASISILEGSSLSEALDGTSRAWRPGAGGLPLSPHPSPFLFTGTPSMVTHSSPLQETSSDSSSKSSGLNSSTPVNDTQIVSSTGSIGSHSSFEVVSSDPSPVYGKRTLPSSLRTTYHGSDIMEYVDSVQVVHCDSIGGRFFYEPHDVILSVPEGATESMANIEIGVTVKGPLLFPKDTKPLSPIVILCMQEGCTLMKPVELTLPHCFRYTEEVSHLLTILKASKPKTHGGKLLFRKVNGSISRGKATVWIKPSKSSPCFFCIGCKTTPDAIARTNYCVVKAMPKSTDETTWQLVLCVSYLLQTCIEMVRRQFGDEYMTSFQPFMFEAAEDREPFIAIHFERFQTTRWSLTVDGANHVAACEVDFSEEDSQAQIDSGLYPPRFNLIVNGERATKDHVAVLTFSGTQRKALEMEIPLLLPTTYTAGGHVRTGSMSVDTESISSCGSFDPYGSITSSHGLRRRVSTSSARSGGSWHSGGLHVPRTVPSRQSVSPGLLGSMLPALQSSPTTTLIQTASHLSLSSNFSAPAYPNYSPPSSHPHPTCTPVRSRAHAQMSTSPRLKDQMMGTILERHLVVITENLKMDLARPYLRQLKVLTKPEHMQLVKCPQVELLVDMLEQKGDEEARLFMGMLETTMDRVPGHKTILDELSQDEQYAVIMTKVSTACAGLNSPRIFRFASRSSVNW